MRDLKHGMYPLPKWGEVKLLEKNLLASVKKTLLLEGRLMGVIFLGGAKNFYGKNFIVSG